ncbi:MAG: Hsp20/alpha crystallin family protein [Alphaproteobacteria bacterium]
MNWHRTLMPLGTSTSSGRSIDPFTAMQREINRVFDDLWRSPDNANVTASFGTSLKMDVKETDQSFTIHAECPGVEEKDIDISFSDNILTIKGEKKFARDENTETLHLVERSYGSFARQIALPGEVDSDKIEARFDKGVLTVTLPKSAKSVEKARKITIKS